MIARAGLSSAAVVDAALAVIDEGGLAALTLAAIAERTGVASPSLYKHVDGLTDLRARVAVRVLDEITSALTSAAVGRSGAAAIAALLEAYRAYAVAHPARYAAVPPDPLHDARLAEAGGRQLTVILAVLRGCGLEGTDAIHTTRALRAMAHGFADIESAGGFGLASDIDESFRRMVDTFVRTVTSASAPTKENS